MNQWYRLILLSIAMFSLIGCVGNPQMVKPSPIERISAEDLQKLMPPTTANVSLDELVADAKQGKTAEQIIAKIIDTQSSYELTPAQTLALSEQGLPIEVLNYIDESNKRAQQNAIADEMNKRQKAQTEQQELLRRQRDLARMQYFDPFWGMYYGQPWIGPIGPAPFGWGNRRFGSRFGFGMRYGW